MTSKTTTVTKTVAFDPAGLLDRPEDVADYVADALQSGHAGYIQHALGVAAKQRGMGEVSEATGLGRESLYKALKEDANPRFDTILKVMAALGLKLSVQPIDPAAA